MVNIIPAEVQPVSIRPTCTDVSREPMHEPAVTVGVSLCVSALTDLPPVLPVIHQSLPSLLLPVCSKRTHKAPGSTQICFLSCVNAASSLLCYILSFPPRLNLLFPSHHAFALPAPCNYHERCAAFVFLSFHHSFVQPRTSFRSVGGVSSGSTIR